MSVSSLPTVPSACCCTPSLHARPVPLTACLMPAWLCLLCASSTESLLLGVSKGLLDHVLQKWGWTGEHAAHASSLLSAWAEEFLDTQQKAPLDSDWPYLRHTALGCAGVHSPVMGAHGYSSLSTCSSWCHLSPETCDHLRAHCSLHVPSGHQLHSFSVVAVG